MEDTQSWGSRLGDVAFLATVCFLAFIKILEPGNVMLLLFAFVGARYAVKAQKQSIQGVISSGQSGQMRQVVQARRVATNQQVPETEERDRESYPVPVDDVYKRPTRDVRQPTPGQMKAADPRREPRDRRVSLLLDFSPVLIPSLLALAIVLSSMFWYVHHIAKAAVMP